MNLIDKLTLDEKLSLLRGATTWDTTPLPKYGIESVHGGDGPLGVKRFDERGRTMPSTVFPCPTSLACSFDRKLVYDVAYAIGEECRYYKTAALYAPGVNIQRSPLCGRNFEYFSEDPYLASEMGISYVNGSQKTGVMATLKHFAVNNQEYLRRTISARVDERALREIYLKPFERVVKYARPRAVMAAYNRVNGVYATENEYLLNKVLRSEWGFNGLVMSDWGAINDRALAVKNGCDLEMPHCAYSDAQLKRAIEEGRLSEEDVDTAVQRVLDFVAYGQANIAKDYPTDFAAHHKLAVKAAEAGAVLLKNDSKALPLLGGKILVAGSMAQAPHYQGTGSSKCEPKRLVTFIDVLEEKGADYDYEPSLARAAKRAHEYSRVVILTGLDDRRENEGDDRVDMRLPSGIDERIAKIARKNANTVVVLHNGAPVEMPWRDEVNAILLMHLAGEGVGEALYDLLYGVANPCGKLAHTCPIKYEDNIVSNYFAKDEFEAQYRESIFVGYRYFDAADKRVAYPFGYGLSYTKFAYSDMVAAEKNGRITVSCKVKNVGNYAGSEVVQLYVSDDRGDLPKAVRELKDFAKVYLATDEEKTVTFTVDKGELGYYDAAQGRWLLSGEYTVCVGASSRDIRLAATVKFADADPAAADYYPPCYRELEAVKEIGEDEFSAVLGYDCPHRVKPVKGSVTEYSSFKDIRLNLYGKLKYASAMAKVRACVAPRQTKRSWVADTRNDPIRYLYFNGSRKYNPEKVDALVKYVNGGSTADFIRESRAANKLLNTAKKKKKR